MTSRKDLFKDGADIRMQINERMQMVAEEPVLRSAKERLDQAVNQGSLSSLKDAWFVHESRLGADIGVSMSDIRALLRLVDVKEFEFNQSIDNAGVLAKTGQSQAAEIERLRGVLKGVHQDLLDRAGPDGDVTVGASVWIALDNAVKGGA
ncbi:hypothetical protein [Paremcibacter congregatus]|uniref:hypothetical protein n=1 Tax=Paremcibacter congregatus TaxID=2043170 RepID=UPI003A8F3C19